MYCTVCSWNDHFCWSAFIVYLTRGNDECEEKKKIGWQCDWLSNYTVLWFWICHPKTALIIHNLFDCFLLDLLTGQPFLPKELELFNTPCAPMSPLSSEGEQSSTSPSPSQSAVPSPAPSSLLENPPKSSGSPDLSSVDSPATGDAPMWESRVMRMYASGPKGRVRKDTQQRQRSDISPNISSDVSELILLLQ